MPKLANLDKKQLTVVVVLVIVLGVLAWQVYGLIGPSEVETPAPTVAKPPAPAVTPTTPALHLPTASPTNPATELQLDPNQKKYLALIEEYKLVELQKLIAADKQAIAAAQASTAESINRINQLGGQASLQDLNSNAETDTATDKKDVAYNLVYTGLQDGSWTATLKQGNNVYDVMKGTVLDGKYNVTDINNDRVLLKSKDEQLTISFDGSVTTPIAAEVANQKSASPTVATPTTTPIKSGASTQGLVQNPPMPTASPKAPANEVVVTAPSPVNIATREAPVVHSSSTSEKMVANPAPVTAALPPSPVTKPADTSVVAAPSLATTTFIPISESTAAAAPTTTPTTSVVKTFSDTVKKEEKKISGTATLSTVPSQPDESPWYKKTWESIKTWVGQETPPEQQAAETLPPLVPHKAPVSPAVTPPVTIAHQELAPKTEVKPEVKPTEASSSAPVVTPFSLATANPAHYTLQVATFETKQKMDTFVASYLKDRSDYFIYQNKKGHEVLVLGDYKTRADATAALDALPKNLRDGKPYPVSIESAQSKMATTAPLAS